MIKSTPWKQYLHYRPQNTYPSDEKPFSDLHADPYRHRGTRGLWGSAGGCRTP